jgi:hypothetical protein
MQKQKLKGVQQGLPEQAVLKQPFEIVEPDEFHRGNDVPLMEGEHNGKNDRKKNEREQMQQIGCSDEIG